MSAVRRELNRVAFEAKTSVMMRADRRAYAEFVRNESIDPELLAAEQDQAAMALARHAYRTTSYYRESFTEAGIDEGDLDDPRTWVHLPVLEKDVLRSRTSELSSRERPDEDRLPSSTGGSTGEPLTVYNDRRAPTAAMWWRVYRWWGVRPSDDSALIYRIKQTPRQLRRDRLQWWPTRILKLDARRTRPEDLTEFASKWLAAPPRLVSGYVGALEEFARFVVNRSVDLPAPHAAAVTASMLNASQRHLIEHALSAPLYDCYRSAEVPWIAAQCHHRDGLHVPADTRRVEIVDAEARGVSPGQVGDVVVTDLNNFAFPIVRYKIGDRSALVPDPCPCGLPHPMIAPIDGRVVDVLRTPTGRTLSGGLGTLINAHSHALGKFQLHQSRDYSVEVRFVAAGSASDPAVELAAGDVVQELLEMLGGEVAVHASRVDEIPHIGGKVRLVISDLD